MKNSIVNGLILMTMVIGLAIGQEEEKQFQFVEWKSQHGKEYEDKTHESLR